MPRRRRAISPVNPHQVYVEEFEKIGDALTSLRQPGPSAVQAEDLEHSFEPTPWQVMVNWRGYHRPATYEDNYIYYHPGSPATEDRPAVEEGWKKLQDGAYFHCKVSADPERYPPPVVGDGEFEFFIPEDCDEMVLWRVEMGLSTAGGSITTVQLRNSRSGDMLSTPITIDGGDYHSDDATTPYAISQSNNQVLFKDRIYIDIDAASASSRGLTVYTFWR
jgi:hypothetical protein